MPNAPKHHVPHVRPIHAVASQAAPASATPAAQPRNLALVHFDEDSLSTLKNSARCKALSLEEFAFFVEVCKRRGLDPFIGQIYAVVRNGDKGGRTVTHQTGIDGFRLIAERTGKYEGQLGPFWCGEDGKWMDVWLKKTPPVACKVGILRRGFREPMWGFARFAAYYRPGGPLLWDTMGDNQIAKCAEALGLRKAFPEDLSGVYIADEMDQADVEAVVVDRDAKPQNVPQPGPTPTVVVVERPEPATDQDAIEAAAVEKFAPQFLAVKTAADLDRVCKDAAEAVGGRAKASKAYSAWWKEQRAQTMAMLGLKGPGPKAAPQAQVSQ